MTEPIRFFLPGPTFVPMDARQAMTKPLMGHRSPAFKELYSSIAKRLPQVLRTQGDGLLAQYNQPFTAVARFANGVPFVLQDRTHEVEDRHLIIDD